MSLCAVLGEVALLALMLGTSAPAQAVDAQPFTVKLQIDKPCCVLNFMEVLRTRGYYGPTLYAHYSKSKFNGDKRLDRLVREYTSVKTVYRYECDRMPKYRFAAKNKSWVGGAFLGFSPVLGTLGFGPLMTRNDTVTQ